MFDGDEGGTVTIPIKVLLDEVCEIITLWIIDEAGTQAFMDDYYSDPSQP